jgi:hypothetical protein
VWRRGGVGGGVETSETINGIESNDGSAPLMRHQSKQEIAFTINGRHESIYPGMPLEFISLYDFSRPREKRRQAGKSRVGFLSTLNLASSWVPSLGSSGAPYKNAYNFVAVQPS